MIKRILLPIFFCISEICLAQMGITLKQPPMNQLRVKDIWEITIINSSGKETELYLRGTVDELSEGQIVEGKTGLFRLKANERRIITVDNIPGGGKYEWLNKKFQEAMIRKGNAPDGFYTICIYAEKDDGTPLGQYCIQQNISQISPPILITPSDAETIYTPQTPIFSWLPTAPLKPGIIYKITIVDILGSQSNDEAIRVNPVLFSDKNISSNTFQYPISARQFEPNKKYGWQITAYEKNNEIGHSEVWSFFYSNQEISEKKIGIVPCEKLKAEFKKKAANDTTYYQITINNNITDKSTQTLKSFKITIKANTETDIQNGKDNNWIQSISKDKSGSISAIFTNKLGSIPTGASNLGSIILSSNQAMPIKFYYEWLDGGNSVICLDSASFNEKQKFYELSEEKPDTYIEVPGTTLGIQFANNYATTNNAQFYILDNYKPIISEKNLEAPGLKGQNITNFSLNGVNKVTIDLHKYKLSSNKIYNLMVADSKHYYYLNFKIVN
jgi:hypothetical protein